jgi:pantoate--beta-alanine ligase
MTDEKTASRPLLLTRIADARAWVARERHAGRRIGLVPTMGALHAGHGSLAERARLECDRVVATVFVNPTQFGPHEDFQRYPRTLAADLDLLGQIGVDMVFAPDANEMYRGSAAQPSSSVFAGAAAVGPVATTVLPSRVAATLEGECRPGHFVGVATVVMKLFQIVAADIAYFGAKDYQQTLVLRRMVEDLDVPVQIVVCPTVREPDGLAMSSRNRYLSPEERVRALSLSRGLAAAERAFAAGERSAAILERIARAELEAAGAGPIDYVALADPETLDRPDRAGDRAVLLIAARVGGTRLIDNRMLE